MPALETTTAPPEKGAARWHGSDSGKARAGDVGKKEQFVEEALVHRDDLYRRALTLTSGDEARSDDLVQITLMKAYRAWDTYENGTNCRAWLMTILRNAFLNAARRRDRRPEEVDFDDVAERAPVSALQTGDPEREFLQGHLDSEVEEAIAALPERFRTPLVLSDLHDYSYLEIASLLDIPVGTVKSRIHRARRKTRGPLRDYAREMGIVA